MCKKAAATKRMAFDFTKVKGVTLDQYMVVRNGFGKGLATIVELSDREAKAFGLEVKKGWYEKHKQVRFTLEQVVGVVSLLTDYKKVTPSVKKRLVSAFIGAKKD